ncbi:putative hemolysin [Shewanella woodyi]|uniref:putative hemolysin n=1 Tax=Shewanella woodyi TaxID=60961 RepID=UPI003747FE96
MLSIFKTTNFRLYLASLLLIGGCSGVKSERSGMENPASSYCLALGGELTIETGLDGQIGICHLPSGESVEEWSLYRRDHR